MKSSKSKNTHTQKGLRLALLFCLLVVGIIFFSVLLRGATAVKGSAFGDFRYNILVNSNNPQVVSIAKKDDIDEKIRIISFEKEELAEIKIPLNSKIESSRRLTSSNLKTEFVSSLFRNKNNIPLLDRVKISLFMLGAGSKEMAFVSASEYSASEIQTMFEDLQLSEDAKSIQVINASGIPGLGNVLANALTSVGGNVVLVTGEDNIKDKSVVIYKKESVTSKFILNYLGIAGEKRNFEEIADVIIILGKDSAGSNKF